MRTLPAADGRPVTADYTPGELAVMRSILGADPTPARAREAAFVHELKATFDGTLSDAAPKLLPRSGRGGAR